MASPRDSISTAPARRSSRGGGLWSRLRHRVRIVATGAAMAAGAALLLLTAPAAQASFNNGTPRATYAGPDGYVVTGGSLRSSEGGCTFNGSSSSTLPALPAGSSIVSAYLYWSGDGSTVDSTVTFNGNNLTADNTFTDTDEENHSYFGGMKDVTGLVSGLTSGATTFTFSGLSVDTSNTYCNIALVYGGWALVVVYSNPSLSNHVINVYDGLQNFRGNSITTTPSGFLVPSSSIDGKTTVVTWEGDNGNSGALNGVTEALSFNGHTLSDSFNPVNNIYNSTINTAPTSTTSWGVDIDTFDVSSYLSAGQTSATMLYSSGADRVVLGAQIISTTTTNVADVGISKSHTGNFNAGSNGTYSIVVHNNGPDPTVGTTTVTDTLPSGLSYVSYSGTGWSCSAAGQTVTCTNTTPIASGANAATLSLVTSVSTSAPTSVTNTASVTTSAFDANSSNNTASDVTTIIGSTPPASGNKSLYLYDSQALSRNKPASPNTAGLQIGSGNSVDWTMAPNIATGKTLVIPAGTVAVRLMIRCDNRGIYTCGNYAQHYDAHITASLYNGTTYLGSSTANYVSNGTPNLTAFDIVLGSAVTVPAGGHLVLHLANDGDYFPARVFQYYNGVSSISFNTSTVINVDDVSIYSVPYTNSPNTTTKTAYNAGDTVYVRAVISDPFGSFDVNHANVTLTDPNGTVKVTSAAMTQVADSGVATRTFEYAYTLPTGSASGNWVAAVTGYEGTENTVTHTRNQTFLVGAPDLVIVKAVTAVSDPVEGTTRAKALPGATMRYQINVSNNGAGTVDNNTLVVTDPIPTNTKFVVGSGAFTDGSPSSGLTLTAANIKYSNDNGSTWTYTPTADGSGADASVTNLQFNTQGTMNAKTGATAPSFVITFKVIIK